MVVCCALFGLGGEVGGVVAKGGSFNAEVLKIAFEVVAPHFFGEGGVLGCHRCHTVCCLGRPKRSSE